VFVLPVSLRNAIDAEVSRVDARIVTTAARALIDAYRSTPERPARPVGVSDDAWRAAYLEMRMPATLAALTFVAGELARALDPSCLTSLLDLGTGPGTALHAFAPALPALERATLVDRDDALLDIAERLVPALERSNIHVTTEQRDIADTARPAPADLVVMAYALGEVTPRDRLRAIERAWLSTRRVLVIVEPGTSAGFARILDARRLLTARGAHLAAPCPHARACPMAAPDWCHVAVRVERTRRMRQIKHGDLGYEDEAIAYLIATVDPVDAPAPRIVSRPRVTKGRIGLPLCTADGLVEAVVTKRDDAWRAARRAAWGDRWSPVVPHEEHD